MITNLDTLVRYRNRAEELRTLARDDHTDENKQALFRIADAYDQMANGIENLLKQAPAELTPQR